MQVHSFNWNSQVPLHPGDIGTQIFPVALNRRRRTPVGNRTRCSKSKRSLHRTKKYLHMNKTSHCSRVKQAHMIVHIPIKPRTTVSPSGAQDSGLRSLIFGGYQRTRFGNNSYTRTSDRSSIYFSLLTISSAFRTPDGDHSG